MASEDYIHRRREQHPGPKLDDYCIRHEQWLVWQKPKPGFPGGMVCPECIREQKESEHQ